MYITSLQTYLENNCTNLVEFVSRMKEKYWSDWESSIEESRQYVELKKRK